MTCGADLSDLSSCFCLQITCAAGEFTVRAPVCLPDVQRLLVHVVVLQRLLVQEVKEVFDGRRNDGVRTQHAAEEIVYELLQRALQESTEGVSLQHYTSPDFIKHLPRMNKRPRFDSGKIRTQPTHLDGQQPGQVDLGDGFGHGLVLHAAAFRLPFIDFVGRPHQVEGVVLLQQRVLC